ncbi:MAG TPA: hypothetical protein VL970_02855, partial [Candidatus Acidoferrales bacterium]|nr:hypothetical protein [Candidatus Acidoferrales bacterium]
GNVHKTEDCAMKNQTILRRRVQAGSALLMTLIMCAVALAILAAAMAWSASSARLTYRVIQYNQSVAAAEAATEKIDSQMTRDFDYGGVSLVLNNLGLYRNTTPTIADSPYWSTWQFDDGNGDAGQTYVQCDGSTVFESLDPVYAGLNGFITTVEISAHASDTASPQNVNVGVYRKIQLVGIPIFQFAMYSSGDMEISCGQPFDVTGRVHSNNNLYVEPDSSLTFESSVTAVVSNLFSREPLDTRGPPAGDVVYVHPELKLSPVQALTLPIGMSNSPEAVREIIEPPPAGESPTSPLGQLRYFNQCDLLIVATNNGIGVTATSGHFNNFMTTVPTNELASFVTVTRSFWDAREGKTVLPIDINVGALTAWNATNASLRFSLLGSNLTSVYVLDLRNLPNHSLGAVRVYNGLLLPPDGLTVATCCPLYVWGDYNEYNPANLGTTNTSATQPASLVADAITFLSDNWSDPNSSAALSSREAASTTVNAALLTGNVPTTLGQYSGGMENFPRFLENWGLANVSTYNGSMVLMFPSLYATNVWGLANVYNPPARNWAFDANFNNPALLPPKTPSLQQVVQQQWATVLPGQNGPVAVP